MVKPTAKPKLCDRYRLRAYQDGILEHDFGPGYFDSAWAIEIAREYLHPGRRIEVFDSTTGEVIAMLVG